MHDLRFALRALRATPVVTAVAILSLALGIGANTAIFSIVDVLVLRMLPAADPQRLAILAGSRMSGARPNFSYATSTRFAATARRSTARSRWRLLRPRVDDDRWRGRAGRPLLRQRRLLRALGVAALAGRMLEPADDLPGGGAAGLTAVISYRLWRERFGGSLAAIGARVTLDRQPITIVGITPPAFLGVEVGRPFDVIMPIRTEPIVLPSIAFDDSIAWLNIVVRMKPGMSIESATAALRAVQQQVRTGSLPAQFQSTFLTQPFIMEPAGSGTSTLRERFAQPLVMMLIVVALVLLIACANIANLLLARGAARGHEQSVRRALGASRGRLHGMALVESAVLACIRRGTRPGFARTGRAVCWSRSSRPRRRRGRRSTPRSTGASSRSPAATMAGDGALWLEWCPRFAPRAPRRWTR